MKPKAQPQSVPGTGALPRKRSARSTRTDVAAQPAGNMVSLDRAISLLSAVAASQEGLRLTDAATLVSLSPSTSHRILSALVEHKLLRVVEGSRRYMLGAEMYRLGVAATRHYSLVELARPSLRSLASQTQDTVSLSVLDGTEALCLDRLVGSYPIRTMSLEIGERRPLGVGAGSLALLAALPAQDRRAIVSEESGRVARYPAFTAAALQRWAEDARRRGYAYSPERVLPGMSGVGVPIIGASGRLIGSISLSGIASRLRGDRLKELVPLLQKECLAVARAASELQPAQGFD